MTGELGLCHLACENGWTTENGPGGCANTRTPGPDPRVSEGYGMSTPQVCDLPECNRPRASQRRMCNSHYMRQYRYGDPYWTAPTRSVDLTGQQFGQLVAVHRTNPNHWLCRCTCGTETVVRTWSLTSGGTTSCGDHRRRESVGYFGVHGRLAVDRGPASGYACVDCGTRAAQWSYSHEDPAERQSPEGPYSLDLEHYAPRCVPCHKTMDLAILAAR